MLKTKDKALRYFKIYKDDINRIDYCGREIFLKLVFCFFLVHLEHGIIYDVDDKKQFLYLNRLYTALYLNLLLLLVFLVMGLLDSFDKQVTG